ncbi:tRNA-splicing endonuclease subunit Sen15 [Delphinella strobiligena]|nr:tRNA-splicing endonuclease subunit Sen15 [Delphinella strobiligena]
MATQTKVSALLDVLAHTDASAPHPQHEQNLAAQILHNLQYQHLWTDLRIHHYSFTAKERKPLPRPLISGLPPQRLYIHPDEQIALLQAQKEIGGTGLGEVLPQREFVCPTQLREKWSLRRFGEVFDEITLEPPEVEGDDEDEGKQEADKWRTTKRFLLATLDDDSTVVYYIVHDGIVKPRQN